MLERPGFAGILGVATRQNGDGMPADPDQVPVIAVASGQPVMITQAVPEQVTAYRLVARGIRDATRSGTGRPGLN
jgi:hypothetical protein